MASVLQMGVQCRRCRGTVGRRKISSPPSDRRGVSGRLRSIRRVTVLAVAVDGADDGFDQQPLRVAAPPESFDVVAQSLHQCVVGGPKLGFELRRQGSQARAVDPQQAAHFFDDKPDRLLVLYERRVVGHPVRFDRRGLAVEKGGTLDLGVDMTTGTGWCFGGPAIKRDEGVEDLRIGRSEKELRKGDALLWKGSNAVLFTHFTGLNVKRAAPGGVGLMLNPIYRKAMEEHLAPFTAAFTGALSTKSSRYQRIDPNCWK